MITRFDISKNDFLKKDITGYFHQYYTGYKKPDNPDFINTIKNTFNKETQEKLIDAKNKVVKILMQDIPDIMKVTNTSNCLCVCVPRAKALTSYADSQLMFKQATGFAANNIKGVIDGTDCIIRFKNTFTTHLGKAAREGRILNDGDEPYLGIIVDTCKIDKTKIKSQNIILIDDIYTKSINIDEDCIQALFDGGAKNIIFYSIGYTRRF